MDETLESRVTLPPGVLAGLIHREDAPSLRRAAAHLALVAAALSVTLADGVPLPVGVLLTGTLAGSLLCPFHESLHGTPFRTAWLNVALASVTGFFQVASPTAYRAFHFHHHRHTHDLEDPEISAAPALLAGWPTNLPLWVFLVSGQPILLAKLMMAGAYLLLPGAVLGRLFPYLPARERGRVRLETALGVVAHGGMVAAFAAAGAAWAWPAVLVVAHLAMGPFLLCEHTGLPMAGSVVARTRSLRAGPVFAWFAWNMNLHAEHHGWPAVPWWRLPELSATLGDRLPHVTTYGAVHRAGFVTLFRRSG